MTRRSFPKLLTILALLVFALPGFSQRARAVSGTVRDKAGNTLPKAVVELENRTSLEIRSYIADAAGAYHFGDLNPDVEFTLKAHYKSHWSKTEVLSKFNEAKHAHIDLVVPID